ncbi:MAG TPA: trigger factor [Actinomycetota bacterium]|nr:trigger factor [Actinomycetota bacterium]
MQTSLEHVGKHTVRVSVEVGPDEAKPILDVSFRHLADGVNVPGFRKGKAPRKVIEAQVGRGAVLQEFLEHALPEFYFAAVRDLELAPIGDPEFDDLDVADVERQGLRFTATVDVRPRLEWTREDYRGLSVERPPAEVSNREVDEQLDRLRERFAELDVVGRPARRGDYVVADIRAYVHDQEIPEASGQDVLYEVGGEQLAPELDKELEGTRSGDIVRANARLPEGLGEHGGKEIAFQALVKEVKSKRLPAVDDDFAKTASEFDTLDELRADVREKVAALKHAAADGAVRDEALRALAGKVDVELPERLVDGETEARVERARQRAEQQGLKLEQVLDAQRIDELQFRSDARAHATRAIQADLALEAVARAEDLRATDEDIDRAIEVIARDVGRSANDVRRTLEQTGQITSLAGDIIRDKALDVVVEHANVVEEGGKGSGSPASEEGKP